MSVGAIFFILLIWIACAFIGGTIADGKGHSFWGFTLLGFALSPLLGIAIALCIPPNKEGMQAKAKAQQQSIL